MGSEQAMYALTSSIQVKETQSFWMSTVLNKSKMFCSVVDLGKDK